MSRLILEQTGTYYHTRDLTDDEIQDAMNGVAMAHLEIQQLEADMAEMRRAMRQNIKKCRERLQSLTKDISERKRTVEVRASKVYIIETMMINWVDPETQEVLYARAATEAEVAVADAMLEESEESKTKKRGKK